MSQYPKDIERLFTASGYDNDWETTAEKLAEEVTRLRQYLLEVKQAAGRCEDENESLRQRVEELEKKVAIGHTIEREIYKDAERYRAAIDDAIDDIQIRIWTAGMINDGWEYPRTKAEVDAAIDAARSDK